MRHVAGGLAAPTTFYNGILLRLCGQCLGPLLRIV